MTGNRTPHASGHAAATADDRRRARIRAATTVLGLDATHEVAGGWVLA